MGEQWLATPIMGTMHLYDPKKRLGPLCGNKRVDHLDESDGYFMDEAWHATNPKQANKRKCLRCLNKQGPENG